MQMKKNNVTGVLVLLVFTVFMISILFVLLAGADVVQKLTDRDQRSYQQRTAVQYMTMRVHQADQEGMVEVRKVADQDVLVLAEMIEGCRYETLVYYDDGYLREMFSEAGLNLPLEFGEKILPAAGFFAPHSGQNLPLFTLPQAQTHPCWGLGAPHSTQNFPVLTAPLFDGAAGDAVGICFGCGIVSPDFCAFR